MQPFPVHQRAVFLTKKKQQQQSDILLISANGKYTSRKNGNRNENTAPLSCDLSIFSCAADPDHQSRSLEDAILSSDSKSISS